MSKIGKGYGSEYHLLRWLSKRPSDFNKKVAEQLSLSGTSIEWPHDENGGEWKGIEFLTPTPELQAQWSKFWPTGRGIHNWDAIGKVTGPGGAEWLLVEAKAHTNEILSDCKASNPDSIEMIQNAFLQVKNALGVDARKDWMHGCYQFANRLATLWFLQEHKISAHLLFMYFTGDKRPVSPNSQWNHDCPADEEGWNDALTKQADLIGLPTVHHLSPRIHKLFLSATT